MAKVVKTQSGFDVVKQKFGDFFESLDLSYDSIKQMGTYAGIGFAIGFVLKKFGTLVFFAVLLSLLVFYGLSNIGFLAIDSEKIKLFLGIAHKATITDVVQHYWNWISNHVPLSASFGVGLFFGYKLG